MTRAERLRTAYDWAWNEGRRSARGKLSEPCTSL